MDTQTKRADRHAKWYELIEQQEKSGLSQTEFCKLHDLSKSNFVYYKGVIKSKSVIEEHKIKGELSPVFSAVQIKRPESNAASDIKIILPNGFQCFISSALDMSQVKRLMEALLSC